jgi:hypothetical protein
MDQIVEINSSPRIKLRHLDGLLDDLEDLNLREIVEIPVRLGSSLVDLGVDNPYTQTVNELIERVFELQEPILAAVRLRAAAIRSIRTA